jgi:GNAT superfamily N-acetyltransferase
MGTELKPISAANLPDVVRIMNESSAGHSFQFRLDVLKYLHLSRFWNFSYESSYLAWAGSQPAGVVLNCVDPAAGEAYSFYWGVVPEFRKRRLSIDLVRTYLAEAKRRGYRRTYADSSADSPLDIYIKLGYRKHHGLIELRAGAIPAGDTAGIEKLDVPTLLSEMPSFSREACSWVARPSFLQAATPFLEVIGLRHGPRLLAWIALTRWTGETTIVALDFRPDAEDAARRLVSYLSTYPPPYSATHVVRESRADVLLRSCGFVAATEWVSIFLDLETYSPHR